MNKLMVIILFTVVSLTWGTTWLAMKTAVETIPPVFATGIRFITAAPFLMSIALLKKTPLLFPTGQRIFQIAIIFFYFAIPFSLMIIGEQYITSSLAAIIFANMPVVILFCSVIMLHEKVNINQIIGLMLAVTSLIILIVLESNDNGVNNYKGVLALLIALFMHGFMYIQCKKLSCNVSVVTFNALPCLCAGVFLLVVGYLIEKPDFSVFSFDSLLSTAYLGAAAGFFGILCYFYLQKKANAFNASLVFLVFPIIAIYLENHIYGNSLSLCSLILLIPLCTGILITLHYSKNKTKKR